MFDVLEPRKLPPVECKHGCVLWASAPSMIETVQGYQSPRERNASNHCAQLGAMADEHVYGSWCYCTSAPTSLAEKPIAHGTFSLQNEGTGPSDRASSVRGDIMTKCFARGVTRASIECERVREFVVVFECVISENAKSYEVHAHTHTH